MPTAEQPILIAGAGIAGLALGAALRRDGRDCRLLDERPALGSAGGAITLWPNAVAALDRIGVGDDVRRASTRVAPGAIRTPSGRELLRLDPDRLERSLGGPLLAVRRGVLVELLHARLDPAQLEFGVSVRGYTRKAGGVSVRTDRDTRHVPVLVGADGYRSAVARTLAPELRESYAGYPAWRGVAPFATTRADQFWGAGKEFGLVPLDDGSTYWFATRHEPAGGTDPDLPGLRASFAGWPEPVPALLASLSPADVSRVDVMDRTSPRSWVDGPVVLLGDAAHPMRPHLGQGGAQALLDAAELARCLREITDPSAAFEHFELVRRRAALRVVRMSRSAGQAVNGPDVLHHGLRLLPQQVMLRRMAAVLGS